MVLACISVIGMIISYSRQKEIFLVLPVLPIIVIALLMIITYITNYCRFRTFGDLLELKSSEKVSVQTINSLGENKPNTLRVYCVFLYICCVVCLIFAGISLVFTLIENIGKISVWSMLLIILLYAVTPTLYFIIYCVVGCYYDNLGKMIDGINRIPESSKAVLNCFQRRFFLTINTVAPTMETGERYEKLRLYFI